MYIVNKVDYIKLHKGRDERKAMCGRLGRPQNCIRVGTKGRLCVVDPVDHKIVEDYVQPILWGSTLLTPYIAGGNLRLVVKLHQLCVVDPVDHKIAAGYVYSQLC